jgi:biopolymer transport protein ExbB/TolQ
MMGAFGKLALGTGNKVGEVALASDISLALVTTACGLTIAIPLIVLTASINIRLRKLEDLVASGVGRVLDVLRETMTSQAYVP